jgi:vacuolar-type H+-ATPase subunit C/Vma6
MKSFKQFLEELDYKVKVDGLPDMYVKANNPSEVKVNLRKIVKKPDMIQSVERVTRNDVRKVFRDKAAGKEGTEE